MYSDEMLREVGVYDFDIKSKVTVAGVTDEVLTCQCCGKEKLKRTVVLKDEWGNYTFYGTICAQRNLQNAGKYRTAETVKKSHSKVKLLEKKQVDFTFPNGRVMRLIAKPDMINHQIIDIFVINDENKIIEDYYQKKNVLAFIYEYAHTHQQQEVIDWFLYANIISFPIMGGFQSNTINSPVKQEKNNTFPAVNFANYVLTFGKFKGQKISEISDKKWLRWASENINKDIDGYSLSIFLSYQLERCILIDNLKSIKNQELISWAKENLLKFENAYFFISKIKAINPTAFIIKNDQVSDLITSLILTEYYGTNDGDEEIDF